MKAIDLTGVRVGRWVVLHRAENNRVGGTQWECRCDCGTVRTVPGVTLRGDRTHSCGCLKNEQTAARSTKHGHSSTEKVTPTYYSWAGMLQRCENPRHPSYKGYGGRGITVCAAWHDFATFLADMGEKPRGKSLDRFPDQNGNYEPGNCRWATPTQQARNRRDNRVVEWNGERRTVAEWAETLGISRDTLWERLAKWPLEEAMSRSKTPSGTRSTNRFVEARGLRLTVSEWSERTGIGISTLMWRIDAGWCPDDVLSPDDGRTTR